MRILNHILCLGTFASLISACLPSKMDGMGGKSGGSELRATLPEPTMFSDDPNVSKKITHYALTINAAVATDTCKSIEPKTEEYKKETNLKATVQMGCDYTIELAIGTKNDQTMTSFYFGKVSLTKDQILPNGTNVTLAVNLTPEGEKAGFKNGKVQTPPAGNNSTDLSIEVQIGNGNGNAATPTPNSGNTGNNNSGSNLTAEQIFAKMWNISDKFQFFKGCGNQKPNVSCITIDPNTNQPSLITRSYLPSPFTPAHSYSYTMKDEKNTNISYTLKFILKSSTDLPLINKINNKEISSIKLINLSVANDAQNTIVGTYAQ